MRITLNLASKPFVELRPVYRRLRWWMALLLLTAVPLWFLLRAEQRHAEEARAGLTSLEATTHKLQLEQQTYRAQMRLPENAAVLAQSEFLNQLFRQKGFSWTAAMMDLETVLPSGLQVMNIEPAIAADGSVTIRMRVNGQRDRAVELVRNLEHSRRFLFPRLAGETSEAAGAASQAVLQPVSASSAVSFDILAEYNPLPRTAAPAKRAQAAGPASAHKPAPQTKPAKGGRP